MILARTLQLACVQRILMCSLSYNFKKAFLLTQNSENKWPIKFPFSLVLESTSNFGKVTLSTLFNFLQKHVFKILLSEQVHRNRQPSAYLGLKYLSKRNFFTSYLQESTLLRNGKILEKIEMLRAVGFSSGFFLEAASVSVPALNLCLKFVTIYYQH